MLVESGALVYEVPGAFTKRHRKRASQVGKSDMLDAKAIAEAVLREVDRLPRFQWSPEREAIRMRYDQRDRLVRERTKHICRLRNAALRLGLPPLPRDISVGNALVEVGAAAQNLRGKDAAIDALVDDVLFAIEDIIRATQRVKGIERRCALSYAGSLLSCLRCTACPQSQQLGWSVTQAPCPTRATPRRLQCVAESLRSPGLAAATVLFESIRVGIANSTDCFM